MLYTFGSSGRDLLRTLTILLLLCDFPVVDPEMIFSGSTKTGQGTSPIFTLFEFAV